MDENGNIRYTVKGEALSFSHKLHIYDAYNREVGLIREKLWAWNATFLIDIMGKNVGMIKKEFTWFEPKYKVDFLNWYVEGDWTECKYNVYSRGQLIAKITEKILTFNDTYVLNVLRPEDELYALMLVLAIDVVKSTQRVTTSVALN